MNKERSDLESTVLTFKGKDLQPEDLEMMVPFKSFLSFEVLIEIWEEQAKSDNPIVAEEAQKILAKVDEAPELRESISDVSVIAKNKDLIEKLMSIVFPPAVRDSHIAAAVVPFTTNAFFATSRFRWLMGYNDQGYKPRIRYDNKASVKGKIIRSCLDILREYYNINIQHDVPMVAAVENETNKLERYYQLNVDTRYIKIKAKKKVEMLSEEDAKTLIKNLGNVEKVKEIIPTENFELHGFITIEATDVTDQEVISSLKHDLLEKESIVSADRFDSLQNKIRSLFGMPDLRLGLAAFPQDWRLFADYGRKIGDSIILNALNNFSCGDFENSVYGAAMENAKPLVIDDLAEIDTEQGIEKAIVEHGIRNMIIAPLYYEDDLIGVMEVGSPKAGVLNSLNALKLREVITLFATAVKRSLEEVENSIQAVIKEECTAIHPTVEWRFRREAVSMLFSAGEEESARMGDIIFEDVYPLYGLSDIRNSSDNRNDSIVQDLVEHLRMTKDIIHSAYRVRRLPVLDNLDYRISKKLDLLNNGLSSGDEISILDFIKYEVEPMFEHVAKFGDSLQGMIDNYKKSLDPSLRIFYNKRKDFEESVAAINNTISAYVDKAQEEAQLMFPHYFEKYKTDGIEHGMYIGQSLVEDKEYDQIYLKNLRLWQFIVMCNIARKTERLVPDLKIPLQTTHLILVQNSPLSIRFRFDEKKFDVDGTYNLRYEIMKKRIDKAIIKGRKERLTQPNKIAIVYSRDKEANEYLKYIEYLQAKGYLLDEVENLELDSMQGVQGLRALRVTVNLKKEECREDISERYIKDAVTTIPSEKETVS